MRRWVSVAAALATAWTFPMAAHGFGDADVAALQVALKSRGLYGGSVDGSLGPVTVTAVRRFQVRRGLFADGVLGPQTRRALGRAPLGRRVLHARKSGWDVASLQFLLAWHGFPSGSFDGALGVRTDASLRRFQRWAGLAPDGPAQPAGHPSGALGAAAYRAAGLSGPLARCRPGGRPLRTHPPILPGAAHPGPGTRPDTGRVDGG